MSSWKSKWLPPDAENRADRCTNETTRRLLHSTVRPYSSRLPWPATALYHQEPSPWFIYGKLTTTGLCLAYEYAKDNLSMKLNTAPTPLPMEQRYEGRHLIPFTQVFKFDPGSAVGLSSELRSRGRRKVVLSRAGPLEDSDASTDPDVRHMWAIIEVGINMMRRATVL